MLLLEMPKQHIRLRLNLWGWLPFHLLDTANTNASTTTKYEVKRGKKAILAHCLLPKTVRPWLSTDSVRRNSQESSAGGSCRSFTKLFTAGTLTSRQAGCHSPGPQMF